MHAYVKKHARLAVRYPSRITDHWISPSCGDGGNRTPVLKSECCAPTGLAVRTAFVGLC
ncbi:hypothetical protein TPADAL_0264a [Treponema pallidum subsp. pallidum DAL-1]|uniref:Uncharacterized protein n=2 Tax=Treponema pallidum TaxID=160 RepID=A0AAU8RMX7_TREPL|nr:hypothetical protein TPESAMD_0264a [Treponema pallidum subsp. pertenue str. SamoaD]AEZ58458.1 hypothetical protein TPECDC2_0264a [Treponema pallidum subsp. pertenue str. CDC2]AEZ59526.1 hypothetical protein TPEGAU_0264a [Treponema pallidum subsp. pertenue str. Gauthier]AEZ60590.1 hypothetical protein TPADAL_0264a [Treponema pallidum subsp. pallidum DAL-1]AGK83914.1 hypothetical protein TPFB_0264a [Treponema pallidum str. Fribourg-Blanc]AJB40289.1 hypothetical protein TENDBA_0264a [Treponema